MDSNSCKRIVFIFGVIVIIILFLCKKKEKYADIVPTIISSMEFATTTDIVPCVNDNMRLDSCVGLRIAKKGWMPLGWKVTTINKCVNSVNTSSTTFNKSGNLFIESANESAGLGGIINEYAALKSTILRLTNELSLLNKADVASYKTCVSQYNNSPSNTQAEIDATKKKIDACKKPKSAEIVTKQAQLEQAKKDILALDIVKSFLQDSTTDVGLETVAAALRGKADMIAYNPKSKYVLYARQDDPFFTIDDSELDPITDKPKNGMFNEEWNVYIFNNKCAYTSGNYKTPSIIQEYGKPPVLTDYDQPFFEKKSDWMLYNLRLMTPVDVIGIDKNEAKDISPDLNWWMSNLKNDPNVDVFCFKGPNGPAYVGSLRDEGINMLNGYPRQEFNCYAKVKNTEYKPIQLPSYEDGKWFLAGNRNIIPRSIRKMITAEEAFGPQANIYNNNQKITLFDTEPSEEDITRITGIKQEIENQTKILKAYTTQKSTIDSQIDKLKNIENYGYEQEILNITNDYNTKKSQAKQSCVSSYGWRYEEAWMNTGRDPCEGSDSSVQIDQAKIDSLNDKITQNNSKITELQAKIEPIQQSINLYTTIITDLNNKLSSGSGSGSILRGSEQRKLFQPISNSRKFKVSFKDWFDWARNNGYDMVNIITNEFAEPAEKASSIFVGKLSELNMIDKGDGNYYTPMTTIGETNWYGNLYSGYAFRVNADGNVECASDDGTTCSDIGGVNSVMAGDDTGSLTNTTVNDWNKIMGKAIPNKTWKKNLDNNGEPTKFEYINFGTNNNGEPIAKGVNCRDNNPASYRQKIVAIGTEWHLWGKSADGGNELNNGWTHWGHGDVVDVIWGNYSRRWIAVGTNFAIYMKWDRNMNDGWTKVTGDNYAKYITELFNGKYLVINFNNEVVCGEKLDSLRKTKYVGALPIAVMQDNSGKLYVLNKQRELWVATDIDGTWNKYLTIKTDLNSIAQLASGRFVGSDTQLRLVYTDDLNGSWTVTQNSCCIRKVTTIPANNNQNPINQVMCDVSEDALRAKVDDMLLANSVGLYILQKDLSKKINNTQIINKGDKNYCVGSYMNTDKYAECQGLVIKHGIIPNGDPDSSAAWGTAGGAEKVRYSELDCSRILSTAKNKPCNYSPETKLRGDKDGYIYNLDGRPLADSGGKAGETVNAKYEERVYDDGREVKEKWILDDKGRIHTAFDVLRCLEKPDDPESEVNVQISGCKPNKPNQEWKTVENFAFSRKPDIEREMGNWFRYVPGGDSIPPNHCMTWISPKETGLPFYNVLYWNNVVGLDGSYLLGDGGIPTHSLQQFQAYANIKGYDFIVYPIDPSGQPVSNYWIAGFGHLEELGDGAKCKDFNEDDWPGWSYQKGFSWSGFGNPKSWSTFIYKPAMNVDAITIRPQADHAKCLTAPGTWGGPYTIQNCDGNEMQNFYNKDNKYIIDKNGWTLHPNNGRYGRGERMFAYPPDEKNLFVYDKKHRIRMPKEMNFCMDWNRGDNFMNIFYCHEGDNQKWDFFNTAETIALQKPKIQTQISKLQEKINDANSRLAKVDADISKNNESINRPYCGDESCYFASYNSGLISQYWENSEKLTKDRNRIIDEINSYKNTVEKTNKILETIPSTNISAGNLRNLFCTAGLRAFGAKPKNIGNMKQKYIDELWDIYDCDTTPDFNNGLTTTNMCNEIISSFSIKGTTNGGRKIISDWGSTPQIYKDLWNDLGCGNFGDVSFSGNACNVYKDNQKVSQNCFQSLWNEAGCQTNAPWGDWHKSQPKVTLRQNAKDVYASANSDNVELCWGGAENNWRKWTSNISWNWPGEGGIHHANWWTGGIWDWMIKNANNLNLYPFKIVPASYLNEKGWLGQRTWVWTDSGWLGMWQILIPQESKWAAVGDLFVGADYGDLTKIPVLLVRNAEPYSYPIRQGNLSWISDSYKCSNPDQVGWFDIWNNENLGPNNQYANMGMWFSRWNKGTDPMAERGNNKACAAVNKKFLNRICGGDSDGTRHFRIGEEHSGCGNDHFFYYTSPYFTASVNSSAVGWRKPHTPYWDIKLENYSPPPMNMPELNLPKNQVQFIRLIQPNAQCLNIAEIRVFNQSGQNIALNKSTTILKQYNELAGKNVVDDNINTIGHSQCDAGNYIDINLGNNIIITRIEIVNRQDCCQERIIGSKLQLFNSNQYVNLKPAMEIGIGDKSKMYKFVVDGNGIREEKCSQWESWKSFDANGNCYTECSKIPIETNTCIDYNTWPRREYTESGQGVDPNCPNYKDDCVRCGQYICQNNYGDFY